MQQATSKVKFNTTQYIGSAASVARNEDLGFSRGSKARTDVRSLLSVGQKLATISDGQGELVLARILPTRRWQD